MAASAVLPQQPQPKSNASADFVAMPLTDKFVDGRLLARFECVLNRRGIPVLHQPLAQWVIDAGCLLQLLRDTLSDGPFVHADETVVQVFKEDGKTPTSTSYMGVQSSAPLGKSIVLYDYDPNRSGQVPMRLLEGYCGYQMTDGYEGRNALVETDGIEHLACWAPVRRPFVETAWGQPKNKRNQTDEAVALIGKLYGLELEHKDPDDAARFFANQEQSVLALHALQAWLEKIQTGVTPKSALGTALTYLRKYHGHLIRHIGRGDLPITNNREENVVRPSVVGRKAWPSSDTPADSKASAFICLLVRTAKPIAWRPTLGCAA